MSRKPIPEVMIVPLVSTSPLGVTIAASNQFPVLDLREKQVEEFLQSRSLSRNSQKAYRQDLQHFLGWKTISWAEVTPQQMRQFKQHLLRQDLETGKRVLSDATVARILGTLHSFYGWMLRCGYLDRDPTLMVEKPKLKEPEVQYLSEEQITKILEAAAVSNLPERNTALVTVLLHGLRASEVCELKKQDYDGERLQICAVKTESKGFVPLTLSGKLALDTYLEWRQQQGEQIQPDSPLFVSHSRRNKGQRIGYDAIRKVVEGIERSTGLHLNTYQFRHTFATDLVLKGMNLAHVMTLTRHKSPQSFQRYIRVADQAEAEAAFAELMNTQTPDQSQE